MSTFSVGEWRADGDSLSITDGKGTRQLEPRAFNVLRYLAERPGKLVTIEELMDALWADVVVTPNAVTRVIAQLRKALGDDARNPQFIQTVARTGYRLIAPVNGLLPESPTRNTRLVWPVAAGVVLIATLIATVMLQHDPDIPPPSVAVLPFENYTGDAELAYLGEGVAEEVINALTRIPGIRVSARSLSFQFVASEQTPLDFAADLDVGYIVEGSVREVGAQIRVSARLTDSGAGTNVWSETVTKNDRAVFEAQDEISRAIALALAHELELPAPVTASAQHVPVPEAYELYLRGRYIWHRRGTEPMQPAIDSFAEAVRIDPQFARAWAALATAYLSYPSYSPRGYETWWEAEEPARKALELDPTIPDAYGVLGTFANVRLDWVAAHSAYTEAIRLDENGATAHYWYSEHLAQAGRYAESLRHVQIALRIDPTYVAPQLDRAFSMMMFGDYERGAEAFARIWDRGVRSITAWNGNFVGSVLTGRFETARQFVELSPLPPPAKELLYRFVDVEAGAGGRDQLVEDIFRAERLPIDYRLATFVGARMGAYEDVIAVYRDRLSREAIVDTRPLWGPGTALKEYSGFVELLDDLNLVDYWNTVAWGSICRREGDNVICDDRNMTVDALEDILESDVDIAD